MIGHDTQMRDWLNVAISARNNTLMRGLRRAPPRSKDLKKRLDALEQAQQLKTLIGQDPY